MPECAAGFLVDNATSIFLANLKSGGDNYLCLGLYLALTGKRVLGKDLLRWGIATQYVPQSRLKDLK